MTSISAPNSHLTENEIWWRDHYNFLSEKGYKLRSRYSPNWVPSWTNTNKAPISCEDGVRSPVGDVYLDVSVSQSPCIFQYYHLLNAQRTHDGIRVSLKSIVVSRHPYEIKIGRFFSTSPLSEDPANHCVPIYDVLKVPTDDDIVIIVMPLLRDASEPHFDSVGEVVDCIHQLFEVRPWLTGSSWLISVFLLKGLCFMHRHHVAHQYVFKLP